jgi:hypothetical protein
MSVANVRPPVLPPPTSPHLLQEFRFSRSYSLALPVRSEAPQGEATKSGKEREGSADQDGRCICLCPQSALQRRSYRAGRDMGGS